MIRNYLKIAFRNLWRNKGFSAINILGLAIGLTACILISFYVIDEMGYDKYNEKYDQICRVDMAIKFGDNHFDGAMAPSIMGPTFAKEFPQVEHFARFRSQGPILIRKGKEIVKEDKVFWVDSSLFSVFTIPFLYGNPGTALTEPHSIVIAESMAKKYFGKADVLGQTLVFDDSNNYRITGVMKDIPVQSHFNADFFLPMLELKDSRNDSWFNENYNTYVLLKPGTDRKKTEAAFNETLQRHAAPQLKAFTNQSMEQFRSGGGYIICNLTPLEKIHLYSNKMGELGSNNSIQYVYIFSATALFILLIACINFMNLSTARSANRAREVGVRKVLGSLRKNLMSQFLLESVLISFFAFALAFIMTIMLLPYFDNLAQKTFAVQQIFRPGIITAGFVLMLSVGLLAGAYPAFILSAYNPVDVLKGTLSRGFKSSKLRNGLVVFQFAISIVLIIGTIVIFRQLNFMQNRDIGFNKDQILVLKNTNPLDDRIDAFKNALKQMPGVKQVTTTGFLPVDGSRSSSAVFTDPGFDINKAIGMQIWDVDEDYIPTLQIKLLAGRNFSKGLATDSGAIILNEAAMKFLGRGNPIGKKLYRFTDDQAKTTASFQIIGVLKNFNFNSLREVVTPLMLKLGRNTGNISLRVETNNITGLLNQIENVYKAMAPGQPFSYSFMDDTFNRQYQSEQRTGKISVTFSVVAILIACLGLFGLVTYSASQRIREIGIRKVLGASVPGLINMLCQDLLLLVLWAACIAFPLSWWLMNKWLQDFAYRVAISWWIFAIAGAAALLIALVTVASQAVKAALMNPVTSLRSE